LPEGEEIIQRLVFLDIDGTLLDKDGTIPPSALSACRLARMNQHKLFICSGRPRSIISDAVLSIGFDGIISSGGAHIEIGNTAGEMPFLGEVILDAVMPEAAVKRITSYFNGKKSGLFLEKNHETFSNRYLLSYLEDKKKYFSGTPNADLFDFLIKRASKNKLIEDANEFYFIGVNKIVFAESESLTFSDIQKEFSGECEIFRGSIPCLGKESGEMGPKGIHKGSGLTAIAEYYGAGIESTIAIGDSDNDNPMIQRAGIGIAMGNADPGLKEIADDITTSIKENGIFNAFLKYGLI
jgi:Cof subfamily protein (haloacid dehalogenase superfamily)